jgi:folate-binding protein YgfZ
MGEVREAVLERAQELWGTPLSRQRYDLMRWYQGYPEYPGEISLECILTEAGQRDALSFTKGCYVGQEVMERSDAIGKVPRTLVRVRFEGVCAQDGSAAAQETSLKGKSIFNHAGVALGKVVSAVADPERGITGAFAFLRTGGFGAGESVLCDGAAGEVVG